MKRARHNLSHYRLLTCNQGELVPCAAMEVLPGDSFNHATTALARVATLVAPLMHPVQVRIHHWYVPYRLIWDEFEEFITARDTPVHPTIGVPTENYTPLLDHLGVPDVDDQIINALPLRAYDLIWNEFYRDQDLDTELVISKASGPDTTTAIALQNCRWEKDYFSSARPYPQFGETGVTIPFAPGTEAPVRGLGFISTANIATDDRLVRETLPGTTVTYDQAAFGSDAGIVVVRSLGTGTGSNARPDVVADLSDLEGGGIDINELRTAFARQRFLEARNRYGSRYTDYLRFLGVRPSDARLQRPEYLGGGRKVISFSEVLSTADSGTADVGSMAGHGIVACQTPRYRRFFEEHGIVLSLVSVRPKVMYSEQLHRMWLRRLKDDYWQKENEMEGPQAVFTQELYADTAPISTIFGYQGRHDDYRRLQSYVSGTFRSTEDDWHLARQFSSSPTLNSSFLSCVPRTDIYAAPSEVQLYMMINHNVSARRLVAHTAKH